MEDINFNQLRCFYVIASEGSIKNACRKLNLSQPAVSIQLKAFEKSVGRPLFERKHRKLSLNEFGKDLFRSAEDVVRSMETFRHSLSSDSRSSVAEEIHLGVDPILANCTVRRLATDLLKDPDLVLKVTHGSSKDLISQLDRNRLDVVLSSNSVFSGSKFKIKKIVRQNMLFVGTKAFKNVKDNFPKGLDGVSFLGPSENSAHAEDLSSYFNSLSIKPRYLCRVDDDDLLHESCLDSNGVALLPDALVQTDIKKKKLLLLGQSKLMSRDIYAVTTKLGSRSIKVRRVLNRMMLQLRSSQ